MNKKFHMTPAKLTAALFAVILLTVPIVTIALPKQERSENENRTLAKFPDIVNHTKMDKAENLGDVLGAIRWDDITTRDEDSWMDKFETYFSDHLVGREEWVRARNEMEKLAGKKEINGVYTVDDQMIQAFKTYDKSDEPFRGDSPGYSGKLHDGADGAGALYFENTVLRRVPQRKDLHRRVLQEDERDQHGGLPELPHGTQLGVRILPHRPSLDEPRRVLRVLRGGKDSGLQRVHPRPVQY